MSKTDYQEIAWVEMKPDVYGGKTCDKHVPRWEGFFDGDMGGDTFSKLTLSARRYPAGTRVTISVPVCPKCHQGADSCIEIKTCDFDWKAWAEGRYS